MNNQIFGSITVTFCLIGYYFSWKYYSKDNFKIAVLLLMICGLALRIFTSMDFFLNTWDERYHALVAKNLLKHPLIPTLYDNPILPYNFSDWTNNHVWLAKPPFPLWIISISIYLFGNNEIAIRIPSIIISTVGILITFNIAKLLLNNKVGWLAAFLYSIHGTLIELAAGRISSDHVETFFIFFTELSIWLAILSILKEKRSLLFLFLSGICLGISVLCKLLPALIVLPVWLMLVVALKKYKLREIIFRLICLLGVSILISAPWFIYACNKFPLEAKEMLRSFFTPLGNVIQEHDGPCWYYINYIRIIFGELIYIPLIWMTYFLIKGNKSVWLSVIGTWIIFALIVFSFAETKRHTYILLIAPPIFILSSAFWFELLKYREKFNRKLIFNVILFLLIALPIRYSIERIKPFEKRERNPQWVLDLKKLNKEQSTENTVLFNYSKPIEAMFYTNEVAYGLLPDSATIENIYKKGFRIIINDNGKLPLEILSFKNVQFVKLNSPQE